MQARTFADMQTYRQVFGITMTYEIPRMEGGIYYANTEIPIYENDAETITLLMKDFDMKDPKETLMMLLTARPDRTVSDRRQKQRPVCRKGRFTGGETEISP